MPPTQVMADFTVHKDLSSISPAHSSNSEFAGGEPQDALIRCIFRTGDLRKVAAMIGTASDDGELCNLHEVLSTGETLLHLAVSYKRKDVVLYLLHHGVPIDEPDDFSQTALQVAASEGNFEMVKLLLEHGADPFMRRPNSFLPLSIVQGDCKILTLLMSECGRKMRESECSRLTADGQEFDRNLSWSESDLRKIISTLENRGEAAEQPPTSNNSGKARSKTLPTKARVIPSIDVTRASFSADSSCETLDGVGPLRATSTFSLSRGTGERKSLRMKVNSLVTKTLRRGYSERWTSKPKKFQKAKNTLTMAPSWSEDIPPSLRFSPQPLQ